MIPDIIVTHAFSAMVSFGAKGNILYVEEE